MRSIKEYEVLKTLKNSLKTVFVLPDEVVAFFAKLWVFEISYEIDEIASDLENHKKGENSERSYELNSVAVVLRGAKWGQTAYCE